MGRFNHFDKKNNFVISNTREHCSSGLDFPRFNGTFSLVESCEVPVIERFGINVVGGEPSDGLEFRKR